MEATPRIGMTVGAGRSIECAPAVLRLERQLAEARGLMQTLLEKHGAMAEEVRALNERLQAASESLEIASQESMAAMRISEVRYRRLFEAARDGILILDPDTRKITDANPFMTELLGYPHEELLGKELWEIGLLKDEEASRAAFRELQEKHFIRHEDLPLQDTAGHRRDVEFVSNLYNEDGRKVIQCNIRDVTQRKADEKALLAARDEVARHALELEQVVSECTCELRKRVGELQDLKAAVDAHSIVAITDARGDITYANDKFCEISKYSREELLGQNHRIVNSGYHPKEFFQDFWTTIARGRVWKGDIRNRAKDGSIYWMATTIFPFLNAQGKPVQYIAIRTDITERKRDEQRLTELAASLAEKIGDLEAFSYSVSHDMRAPLRAMQGFAQILVDEYNGKLDERGLSYLDQIMRSAVRLDRLIQDVLSYSGILHAELPMEPVDLDRLIRDIIETYPNGGPIKREIQIKGTLPKVVGNPALLTQCVSNLLSNGIKFVSPGTTPRVEISAEPAGDAWIRVWFKDNGIGIAPENHDRIFRMFERIHPATEYEGTGIGLTIVRKAIQRMGAQVGFKSEPGKGSKFWIQLKKG